MQTNKETKQGKATKTNRNSVAYKVGNAIEKLGDKVERKGFKKAGSAIEKFGDKIEHLQDNGKTAKRKAH